MGQTGERSYAERQRQPGDYEVQVSQRPIAIHALENLATSDRGVSMLRRLVREGIRALPQETAPREPSRARDGRVSTFCQDTVWSVHGMQPLAEFGAAVADNVIGSAGDPVEERCARLLGTLKTRFKGGSS